MVKVCEATYPTETTKYNDIFSKYPFELDHFQKYAIQAIEEDKHVLITAHTGSGKTLPAEYAIQKFCRAGKKVIYTSPIKSLSNQKYYEFSKKYPDIQFGILTGDIKFNPEADCIIMTTEILRNTLFRGEEHSDENISNLHFEMDIQNELACVIFDEIHYINDADRGKVWEETIIKLPKQVRMVMLSATIDRPDKFADWIETTKQVPVWLTSTDIRVVPLTHYSYFTMPSTMCRRLKDHVVLNLAKSIDGELIPLKQQHNAFQNDPFQTLSSVSKYMNKWGLYVKQQYVLNRCIRTLNEKNLLPAICFVYSRKNVEKFAKMIEISLFNEEEGTNASLVQKKCKEIMMKLPNYKEYIVLPEYLDLVSLLMRGIAIHHSGIMPVLREMVEVLFGMGYIKLLFATETFAVGVNMPAKTVLFTALSKFDGSGFRNLLSHEYTQMAGRAGRRGLDTVGHVVHLNNLFELPLKHEYKMILGGAPPKMSSKFIIDLSLIMRLVHAASDTKSIHSFIEKSMMQNVIQNQCNTLTSDIDLLRGSIESKQLSISSSDMSVFETYHDMMINLYPRCKQRKQRKRLERRMNEICESSKRFKYEYAIFADIETLRNQEADKLEELDYAKRRIASEIKYVLGILSKHEFVVYDDNDEDKEDDYDKYAYSLTKKGEMSIHLQEVNCLAFADIIQSGSLSKLSPIELVSVLSSFTDLKVQKDIRYNTCQSENVCVFDAIKELEALYTKYYDIELCEFQCVDEKKYTMNYDMNDIMIDWCHASTEEECMGVLQQVYDKGVFLGAFVKMMLKINNIAKELIHVCEQTENVELHHSLSQIPELTLKYVVSNQSLYV